MADFKLQYTRHKISEKEFRSSLDKKLQELEDGVHDKEIPREKELYYLCPVCKLYKKTKKMVKSDLMGEYHPGSVWKFKYIITCKECAPLLESCQRALEGK